MTPDAGGPQLSTSTSICVIGCGYVGLVTAVGLAEQGFRVAAFDSDSTRVAACRALEFPILEPGLREAALSAGPLLSFHDTNDEGWPGSDITFLSVPTPQGTAGYPNLTMLAQALRWIAARPERITDEHVIVVRSTVPPGTAQWASTELHDLTGRHAAIVANPEFLQEGRALDDFRSPSRVLIGTDEPATGARMRELMAFSGAPIIVTDTRTAELAKYGSNAFLAMRISFANEIARLAEAQGADPLGVLSIVGMDPRIGSRYLHPGIGYGGSCLPKDVAALVSLGSAVGQPMALIEAVREVNDSQRRRVVQMLADALEGLTGKRVAVLGLAFKPHTNDSRDSPGLAVAKELLAVGANVVAWDPLVSAEPAMRQLPGLIVESELLPALRGAEAAILCTEWPAAVELDFAMAAGEMAGTVLVDGRYVWNEREAAAHGLRVLRVGSVARRN